MALSLVHELGHQELFLLNLVDRLIQASSDYTLAHAPYQGKLRPPIGRLHSAHALFRMIQFENGSNSSRQQRHQRLLNETIETFAESETTPFAWKLLHEVY